MRLTEPNQAYPQIWKALTGEKVAVEQARNLLEKKFSSEDKSENIAAHRKQNSGNRKTVVLLVDELDMLWNRKQSVLYNIFEWPANRSAKLVVLAIANTMDLPVSNCEIRLCYYLSKDLSPTYNRYSRNLS